MIHFAKIVDGFVENVIVAEQSFIDLLRESALWVPTNTNNYFGDDLSIAVEVLKQCASLGGAYDSDSGVFTPAKPYDSWILDETTWQWEAPVALPEEGDFYNWNELTQNWISATY
tara:strand:+ start:1012 stop:1356 length:345 start_codon:yes stop_codon:yes gene_type:complete